MICEYKDNFKVVYVENLHISKGDGFEINIKEDQIPSNVKHNLDLAVEHKSCSELRTASRALTNTINQLWDIE